MTARSDRLRAQRAARPRTWPAVIRIQRSTTATDAIVTASSGVACRQAVRAVATPSQVRRRPVQKAIVQRERQVRVCDALGLQGKGHSDDPGHRVRQHKVRRQRMPCEPGGAGNRTIYAAGTMTARPAISPIFNRRYTSLMSSRRAISIGMVTRRPLSAKAMTSRNSLIEPQSVAS